MFHTLMLPEVDAPLRVEHTTQARTRICGDRPSISHSWSTCWLLYPECPNVIRVSFQRERPGCFHSRGAHVYHVQAKFSDDGTSIVVSFSLNGSASSGLLDASDLNSGSGPGSCDALFNGSTQSVLGDGAICEYQPMQHADKRLIPYLFFQVDDNDACHHHSAGREGEATWDIDIYEQ